MKIIALVFFAWFSIGMRANAVGEELFGGVSLDSAHSTNNGAKNSSLGFTGLMSPRFTQYYGLELQAGYFGKSGPFTRNVEIDLTGVGFLPLGGAGFNLYGKAGAADVYSWSSYSVGSASSISANKVGLTYGAGLEFQRKNWALRVGFQRFNVGNNTLSPSLTTNLSGITLLVK